MKNKAKLLFIEGTADRSNGILRQGFHKLLKQLLAGKMPRIIMGNGKTQVITKFKKNTLSPFSYLLIDLDADEKQKQQALVNYELKENEAVVFFMIQEMEAWFISQPQILDKYYKTPISAKLPNTNPKKIANPVAVLEKVTRDTQKGKYHKVKHGTALLELLDAHLLKNSFNEFNQLITRIVNE